MSRVEKAVAYYKRNFNCSQAVFTTYAVECGMDEKLALKIATNFGGGARKGELCGAVSGAMMVLGLLFGHSESEDTETKKIVYALSEEYMTRFAKVNGSTVCRDLLGYDLTKPEDMEIIKEKQLFTTKCVEMVQSAVEVLEELLAEKMGEELRDSLPNILNENKKLYGKCDGERIVVDPKDLLYIEKVDEKTFAYTQERVVQLDLSLQALEDMLKDIRYFRCSKSMIVNVDKVERLKSLSSNRIDTTLCNGEHILISRTYASEFRKLLRRDRNE